MTQAKNTLLSQEQLTKLANDAYAFIEMARLAEQEISAIGAQPTSAAHISLKTAMMVNAGLSIELTLKLIHHKLQTPVPSKKLYSHFLVALFDLLDKTNQGDLEKGYESVISSWTADGGKTTAKAWITSATAPNKPSPYSGDTLRDVFEYLDEATLFLRRYTFEDYSPREWWIEFEYAFLRKIYDALVGYANGLP